MSYSPKDRAVVWLTECPNSYPSFGICELLRRASVPKISFGLKR